MNEIKNIIILNLNLYKKINNLLKKSKKSNDVDEVEFIDDTTILQDIIKTILHEQIFIYYENQCSLHKDNNIYELNGKNKDMAGLLWEKLAEFNKQEIKTIKCNIIDMSFSKETIMNKTSFIAEKGLITYFNFAYVNKFSIVLSPDIIWKYIFLNLYGNHKEKKIFNYNSKKINTMEGYIQELCESVKTQCIIKQTFNTIHDNNTNRDMLITNISHLSMQKLHHMPYFTTTKKENIISLNMVVADETSTGIKEYIYRCKCGTYEGENIPSIIIEGTKEDWILLKNNYNNLYNNLSQLLYDEKNYVHEQFKTINKILDNFIASYNKEDINYNFWKNIYYNYDDKNERARGPFSGWISHITGFDCQCRYNELPNEISYFKCGDNSYISGISRIQIDYDNNLIRLCDDTIQFTMTPIERQMPTMEDIINDISSNS